MKKLKKMINKMTKMKINKNLKLLKMKILMIGYQSMNKMKLIIKKMKKLKKNQQEKQFIYMKIHLKIKK